MFRPNLPVFFVESASNRGSGWHDRRILAKKGGSMAIECKDMIANVRKWKKVDMLYVGMTALITLLTAGALHFVDIRKSHLDAEMREIRQRSESPVIYIRSTSVDHT